MNNPFQFSKPENPAQDYYPKALNLDEKQQNFSSPPPSSSSPEFSSLISNLFSGNNTSQNIAPLIQLLGGNSIFSSLFSGNQNQNEMLTNLISSLSKSTNKQDGKEKIIELKNSIEEL